MVKLETTKEAKTVQDPETKNQRNQEEAKKRATEIAAEIKRDEANSEFSPTQAKKGANSLQRPIVARPLGERVGGVNLNEEAQVEEEPPKKKNKSNKTVRWAAQDNLEEVKYFKMNDEPNKAGLSLVEVQEIQKHLADVPAHLIPSEM